MSEMQFRVQITCDNAAFEETPQIEIARILRRLAGQLEAGHDFGRYRYLLDTNGNTVGVAKLAPVSEF